MTWRASISRRARLACCTALAASAASGCMTSRVEESKSAATGITGDESVVILARSYHKGNATEDGFLDCVSEALQKGPSPINVYPEEEFVDAMFPWFEPRTMPQAPDALPELLARPEIAERINESGVRYIVWVNGSTERTADGGSLTCALGPGGGGCFGFAWWENDSSYEAAVWDIHEATSAGEVSADVRGTSMMPALIVPLPFIARTQATACKGLARELQTFIVNSGPT